MLDWNNQMDAAPRDGTEIMLFYRDWCGAKNLVVSGHWDTEEPFEEERTWVHSLGYGDAEMWAPMPEAPDLDPLPGDLIDYVSSVTPVETPLLSMAAKRNWETR